MTPGEAQKLAGEFIEWQENVVLIWGVPLNYAKERTLWSISVSGQTIDGLREILPSG